MSGCLLSCFDLYMRECIFILAFVWFKWTAYILSHHLCALILLSLTIIFCYWNSFILLCCVICIVCFLFCVPFMSSPVTTFYSGRAGGAIVEQKLRSNYLRVQGTFLNSTTRLRVRVPLRKVCAIILVSCITMDLTRLGVHKFFTGAISKL